LLKTFHFMLELKVLALVVVHLLTRLTDRAPAVIPAPAIWQRLPATAVHVLRYVFMAVMPILGWLMLRTFGKPIPFFSANLPSLVSEDRDLAGQLKKVHEAIRTFGYFLIGAHAPAAR